MGKSCLMLFQSVAGQYPVRPVFQAQGCRNGFLHTHSSNTGVPQTPSNRNETEEADCPNYFDIYVHLGLFFILRSIFP